jgi:hypothetical protein
VAENHVGVSPTLTGAFQLNGCGCRRSSSGWGTSAGTARPGGNTSSTGTSHSLVNVIISDYSTMMILNPNTVYMRPAHLNGLCYMWPFVPINHKRRFVEEGGGVGVAQLTPDWSSTAQYSSPFKHCKWYFSKIVDVKKYSVNLLFASERIYFHFEPKVLHLPHRCLN